MRLSDRVKFTLAALGWQSGTVDELCRELNLDARDFEFGSAVDVGNMASDFTAGWFAIRTCGRDYFVRELLPARRGNLQFWFGVMAGLNCAQEAECAS